MTTLCALIRFAMNNECLEKPVIAKSAPCLPYKFSESQWTLLYFAARTMKVNADNASTCKPREVHEERIRICSATS